MKPHNEVILERFGLAGKDYQSKLKVKYGNYNSKQLDNAICEYHFKAGELGAWTTSLAIPVTIGSLVACGIAGTFFGLNGNIAMNALVLTGIIESVPFAGMCYFQLKEHKFSKLREYKFRQKIIDRYKE